jgi:hypothetical protein
LQGKCGVRYLWFEDTYIAHVVWGHIYGRFGLACRANAASGIYLI